MRVQRRASKSARAKGSQILRENEERMKNSGHRGEKHFVNPNKLFVGNLDFRITEADLMEFFKRSGVSAHIQELKIVTDWRSGDSKGYGFVVFREPIQATSALTHIVGRKLMGRVVNLNQGEKKRQKTIYLVKRDKTIPVIEDGEDDVIATAIGAKGEGEVDTNVDLDVSELIEFQHETEDTVNGLLEKVGMGDSLLEKTSDEIFIDEYESNDDLAGYEFDGNYDDELKEYYKKQAVEQAAAEGAEEEEPMNREQRRIAASRWRKKIRKGPGFGNGYDYQTDTHTDNPYEGRNIMDVEDFEAGFGNGYDYQTDTHTDNPYEGRNIMDVEDFEAQEEIL
eukprot:CAMPEP_0171324310 /NCGR_PEP_ID=MMETSP0816-20121228/116104_1 /TAXON_ID=420281 /ORGANISM="Proboscia inermis, Strain CCAP1064/1" /LENGTH=337 /DNA_ID=CAMNT_0011823203 /DNA_START=122 /DNA_END=1136 /DNA_ORIENTATION=-